MSAFGNAFGDALGSVQMESNINFTNVLFITINGVDYYMTMTIDSQTFYLQY